MMMEPSTFSLNRQAVEWLLKRMATFWGKAFFDKWSMLKDGEMLEAWSKAMRGLTELEFRRGVSRLHSFERPPSLPEFLKVCRPEVNFVNAYYEALEGSRSREQGEVGTWSHPAIYWASVRVSAHDLKNQTYSQIRQRWESALATELEKDQWESIPVPLIALPSSGRDKISKENAIKMMTEIKKKAGISEPKGDHKRWAKVILERLQQGDKTLSPVQISFARQALRFNEDETND